MAQRTHNQARRKNAILVSFLCPLDMLGAVDEALKDQQSRTLKVPLPSRSAWIVRAIQRELQHRQRSRRSGRNADKATNDNAGNTEAVSATVVQGGADEPHADSTLAIG